MPRETHCDRRQQAGSRFKILEYRKGELVRDWYRRHGVWVGNVDPEMVPFYLLIVGAPTEIPFEFQYLLGIEYAVGRLGFQQAEDYACYARSAVAYEEVVSPGTTREIVFWSTRDLGDAATNLSNSLLVKPLAYGTDAADGTLNCHCMLKSATGSASTRLARRPEGRCSASSMPSVPRRCSSPHRMG